MLQESLTNFQTGWRLVIIFCLSNFGNPQEIFALGKASSPRNNAEHIQNLQQRATPTPSYQIIPRTPESVLAESHERVYFHLQNAERDYKVTQLKRTTPRLAGENDTSYHNRVVGIANSHIRENFGAHSDRIRNQIWATISNHNSFRGPNPGETYAQFDARVRQAERALVDRIMVHRRNAGGNLDTASYYSRAQSW